VQAEPLRFVSDAVPTRDCLVSHTSGTTGAGLRFPVTRQFQRDQYAVWWRYRDWHGLKMDAWCAYFGGRSVVSVRQTRPPYWRYNRPGRQVLFSGYHLSPDTAALYLMEMQRLRLPWIHGYPSMISLLASFAVSQGIRLDHARWVTTGAENLLPYQARVIEQAFGVRPIQHYGMSEGVANISLCPEGKMHVDEDFAAVEFVPQEVGGYAILGTNFTNSAFPLLRYEVGDVAQIPADATCACGRPGRVIGGIDGRKEDFIITKRRVRLGRLDHIFKDQVNIRESQIIQNEPGHMIVCIVRGNAFTPRDEHSLRQQIVKRVGHDVTFEFRYVPSIERTTTGKLRFVVSTVAEGALTSVQVESPAADAAPAVLGGGMPST
jgi:phenylacetate-CoA ligase